MKKLFYVKKKGFTLIELLAVIVILAIILLIAMPIVLNVIGEARKGAFESSAYGLAKTSENECMANIVKGDSKIMEVVFEDGVITSEDMIAFSGRAPTDGVIVINQNCKVQMAINDGYWCVQKAFNNKEVTVTRLSDMTEDCEITDFAGLIEWTLQEDGKLTAILPSVSGPNVEYSKDGVDWQSSRTFVDLEPGTTYTFRVRIDGVETDDLITVTSPNVYQISYQAGTGGSVDPLSKYVLEDEIALGPDVTENTGYDFVNFTVIEGFGNGDLNLSNGNISNVIGDMTIRANFAIRQYTVNYQSNGGATFDPNYRTVNHGSDATTPSVEIEEGYTFSHYTVITGVGNGDLNTSTGNVTNVIGNMTIEASFTLNEYTVSYIASTGGTVSTASRVVTHGGDSAAPGHSANTGYTFDNFSITSGSGNGTLNTSTGAVTNVIGNLTVRANFTINTYTVSYTAGTGGSVNPTSESVNWSSANIGTTPSPSTGYSFTNYTLESGTCNGTFNTSTGICSDVRGAITVRANFAVSTYTLTTSVTGSGTINPSAGIHTYNHGANVTVTNSASTGHTFTGWSGSCSGTGSCSVSMTQNRSVGATFTINQYTVTYDGNGGTCIPNSRTVNWGTSAAGPSCSRSGSYNIYELAGFTITSGSCAGTFTASTGACSNVQQSMTIRANWTTIFACGGTYSWQGVNYTTVVKAGRCWFAENLRYAPSTCLNATWNDVAPFNACRSHSTSWGTEVLYQWGAAMNGSTTEGAQGLCPSGWTIPTDQEWKTLEMNLGMTSAQANGTGWRGTVEGHHLKSSSPDWEGVNLSGLNAKPVGRRTTSGDLVNVGVWSAWYSSTMSSDSAWYRLLGDSSWAGADYTKVNRNPVQQANGHAVRCVR